MHLQGRGLPPSASSAQAWEGLQGKPAASSTLQAGKGYGGWPRVRGSETERAKVFWIHPSECSHPTPSLAGTAFAREPCRTCASVPAAPTRQDAPGLQALRRQCQAAGRSSAFLAPAGGPGPEPAAFPLEDLHSRATSFTLPTTHAIQVLKQLLRFSLGLGLSCPGVCEIVCVPPAIGPWCYLTSE